MPIPTIGLTPVASPTNKFFNPEVRHRGGGTFASLAAALSQAAPEIGNSLINIAASRDDDAIAKAQADSATHQFANKEAFQAAVKRGDIPEAGNPWYRVAMSQEIARNQVRSAYDEAVKGYEASGLVGSEDTGEVEQYFNEHFAPVVQGRDGWEMEAIAPALKQARSQLMRHHTQTVLQYREVNRATAMVQGFDGDIQTLDPGTTALASAGDPAAKQRVDQIAASLQARVDEAAKTMHPAKVNALLVESASATALVNGDVNLAPAILNSITTNGTAKLGQTSANKLHMEQLADRITSEQLQQRHRLKAVSKEAADQQVADFIGAAQQEAAKENKFWWEWSGLRKSAFALPPQLQAAVLDSQSAVMSDVATIDKDAKEQAARVPAVSLWKQTLSKMPDSPDKPLLMQMADRGDFGGIENFFQLKNQTDQSWAKETDPSLYTGLHTLADAGDLTFDRLTELAITKRIDKTTFNHFSSTLGLQKNKEFAQPASEYTGTINEAIRLSVPASTDIISDPVKTAAEKLALDTRTTAATLAFREGLARLVTGDEYKQLGQAERMGKQAELFDKTMTAFGGLTRSEVKAAALTEAQKLADAKKQIDEAGKVGAEETTPLTAEGEKVKEVFQPSRAISPEAANRIGTLLEARVSPGTAFSVPGNIDRAWGPFRAAVGTVRKLTASPLVYRDPTDAATQQIKNFNENPAAAPLMLPMKDAFGKARTLRRILDQQIQEQDAAGNLQKISDKVHAESARAAQLGQPYFVNGDDKRKALVYFDMLDRSDQYHKMFGYDANEVAKMEDPAAPFNSPVFDAVHEMDDPRSFDAATDTLNIKPEDRQKFYDAQLRLLLQRKQYADSLSD